MQEAIQTVGWAFAALTPGYSICAATRLMFLVGLAGTTQIDDVRVWENTR